jgi:hypothetical protein
MTLLASPAEPIGPIQPITPDGYVPGACNIGEYEIRRRRRSAIAGFAIAAAVLVGLLAADLPAWTRLVVLIPAWGAAVTWLQARRRFCVGFAAAGISNFGDDDSGRQAITDPAQRAADRRKSLELIRDGFVIGLVITLVAVLLPV